MTESERQRLVERLRMLPRPESRIDPPEAVSGDVGDDLAHDANAGTLSSFDTYHQIETE